MIYWAADMGTIQHSSLTPSPFATTVVLVVVFLPPEATDKDR